MSELSERYLYLSATLTQEPTVSVPVILYHGEEMILH